ncbi:YceD family protein [Thioalkalivibrio sp. HK1]|uniref:YceD family protein n=1 Tax=Thioalkalivibrio sp. HK1 TaxID=1469245 RepID=UPI0004AD0CE1|nr:YceD family protein [Thioalkalivibrio sp. HK1]
MNLDPFSMPLEVDDLAARRATLEGEVSPSSMPRLSAQCLEGIAFGIVRFSSEPIRYRLEFRRDDGGALRLRVGICATVVLRCQRCLEPFDHRIDTRSHFRILSRKEDMQADPSADSRASEILYCPEGRLMLEEVIEDEILLALPDIPKHEEGSLPEGEICRIPTLAAIDPAPSNSADPARSPFAALDSLIEKR